MTIELGQKIRCKVTGFEGIAISRVEYLNGCIQYCIKPKVGKDGKILDGIYIDEEQLEVIGKGLSISEKEKKPGGTMLDVPLENQYH